MTSYLLFLCWFVLFFSLGKLLNFGIKRKVITWRGLREVRIISRRRNIPHNIFSKIAMKKFLLFIKKHFRTGAAKCKTGDHKWNSNWENAETHLWYKTREVRECKRCHTKWI